MTALDLTSAKRGQLSQPRPSRGPAREIALPGAAARMQRSAGRGDETRGAARCATDTRHAHRPLKHTRSNTECLSPVSHRAAAITRDMPQLAPTARPGPPAKLQPRSPCPRRPRAGQGPAAAGAGSGGRRVQTAQPGPLAAPCQRRWGRPRLGLQSPEPSFTARAPPTTPA